MNDQLHKQLENLSVPEIQISEPHKLRLRGALLHYAERQRSGFFGWLGEIMLPMFTKLKVSSFVLGVLATLLAGSGVYAANNSPLIAKYNPFASKTAIAKAQMKDILFRARRLSPEEQAEISARFQADMQSSLEEALQAKDLTYVTGEEIMGKGKGAFAFSIAGTSSASGSAASLSGPLKDMEVVKQLKYTDKNGATVMLGVNKDNIPVFKVIQLSLEDQSRIQHEVKTKGFFGFPATQTMQWTGTPPDPAAAGVVGGTFEPEVDGDVQFIKGNMTPGVRVFKMEAGGQGAVNVEAGAVEME